MLRSSKNDRPSGTRQTLVLLTCLSFASYFAYHSQFGRYGFEARSRLAAQKTLVDFEIESLEASRHRLSRDIKQLAKNPPAKDIVEETAASDLGFVYPDARISFD